MPEQGNSAKRNTKIVATLGPGSDALIERLLGAGVDVFRLNFSHGSHTEHGERIRRIRAAAETLGTFVAILADLQGPKIRICGFAGTDAVELVPGASFSIDGALGEAEGTPEQVGTTYPTLADEVAVGDVLVLGDGLLELRVEQVAARRIDCRVLSGGTLGSGKGINKRGGGLSARALTDKDREDLAFACDQGVDYIAVSFPASDADMHEARELIARHGDVAGLVAKLERAEAVTEAATLDGIILASDAVMVARGDLGIEVGDAPLMGLQKRIIARARALNRAVITATQMMESMITNPRPTRAEVMDVANAVVDGTDAVMLSAETAVGRYPVETVAGMVRIIEGAEATTQYVDAPPVEGVRSAAIDESVAMAAMTVANTLSGVRAVACLTASGNTPKLMSRRQSRLPIYALANDHRTLARVALFRGVHPAFFETYDADYDRVDQDAVAWLKQAGVVSTGNRVIVAKGDRRHVPGGTNTLKVLEVT
ncbi:MAG: pyruvate kinase [Pseudomonadota bacterium]